MDIKLFKLTELNDSVDVSDIEPIFAKLVYQDIKQQANKEAKDEKSSWKSIFIKFKSGTDLTKPSQLSGIGNFLLNVFFKIFPGS